MGELVGYELKDGVAWLTLDDGKANALSFAMSQAIGAALDRAASEAKVVVLRGRPGFLGGGFDLKVIRGGDAAARAAMVESGMALISRLYLLPQPLVIACTGHAVAAGALTLLTGDIRIGLKGAFRIGLNETSIGLSLPPAGVELARDRLVPGALVEATLGARLYSPDEALAAGYLDRAVYVAEFDSVVAQAVQACLKLDGTAYAATKARLRGTFRARCG
jgi:enoyl-CoA hydratase